MSLQFNPHKKNAILSYLLTIILLVPISLMAQDEELQELDFTLRYFKRSNGAIELKAHADAYGETGYIVVPGLPISFYMATDAEPLLIQTVETNAEGNALIFLPDDITLYRDDDGFLTFTASFDGNKLYGPAEAEVMFKEVVLSMELQEEDGERSVLVQAHWINKDGEEVPITEEDVFIYVKGMLSYLQIADGYLEDGSCYIPFPENIPGNRNGDIMIFARIAEHDEYGNVEVSEQANWGVIPKYLQDADGKLWTSMAPTWMIILLIILLSGVWGHYIFAVIQMIRLKKDGQTDTLA